MQNDFLYSIKKQFNQYKSLGEAVFDQLNEKELFWQYNNQSNSIAVIVNHLSGNMKSRWTDFLESDGEKPWRNRDIEFEDEIKTRPQLTKKWSEGWHCLFRALETINETNFGQAVLIRGEKHTITEALHRQLTHYASHIGQIIYIGRMIKAENWQSLSIPKGASEAFNQKMFSKNSGSDPQI